MPEEENFCVDCVHCRGHYRVDENHNVIANRYTCERFSTRTLKRNLVTGEQEVVSTGVIYECESMRFANGICGETGIYFERKQPEVLSSSETESQALPPQYIVYNRC